MNNKWGYWGVLSICSYKVILKDFTFTVKNKKEEDYKIITNNIKVCHNIYNLKSVINIL